MPAREPFRHAQLDILWGEANNLKPGAGSILWQHAALTLHQPQPYNFARKAVVFVSIYVESNDVLEHMFNACSTDQIHDFMPERRSFRIHGHSTSLRLERVFWTVLETMAEELKLTLPELVVRIHEQCMVANDKNLASCLRVICMKYINVYN